MKPKERLRRLKQLAVDRMAAINNAALAQHRELNETERLEYDSLKTEAEALTAEIAELESLMGNPGLAAVPKPAAINADEIVRLERERVTGIETSATAFLQRNEIDAAFVSRHKAGGSTIEQFKSAIADHLAARSAANPTNPGNPTGVTRDAADTRRELMTSALLGRMNPAHKVDDQNGFRRMSCLRMVEEALSQGGRSVRGLAPAEIALLAMQQTSDFPAVLENTARKQMLAMYQLANPTYRIWAKPSTSPDFKTMTRVRLSEAPTFLPVKEGAQITIAPMSDSKESYALGTLGRGVAFTRQMLINDDLGAFNDLLSQFGAQAARMENKTVYAVLTANAAMSDTVALFHATHANLGTGVIGNTGLDAMFTAMAIQKGLDAVSVLNLQPKYLIVPAAKASTAANSLTATGPNLKPSDQNWFAGRLTPVADAELDGTSTIVWYGVCDPTIAPAVEYCHLEGATGPQIVREQNDDGVLGVTLYAFEDFAAKAVDYRPIYKSSGA